MHVTDVSVGVPNSQSTPLTVQKSAAATRFFFASDSKVAIVIRNCFQQIKRNAHSSLLYLTELV